MNKELIVSRNPIKDKIHNIRGVQVILDSDLARLYNVETKQIKRAVKRNLSRFPLNFMFKLTKDEMQNLRYQIGTSSWGGQRYYSYAFTEQGVAMLSGVLRSDTAIKISIQIMNAFVSMRKFLLTNAQLFQRIDKTEQKILEHDEKFEKVFDAIENKEVKQGIFFNGQIFDAYKFVSDLVRSAKKSIILIDNYVDDSVLVLFSKREKDVKVVIYTKNITKQLKLDLAKYNSQYLPISIKEFKNSHDRFLIVDDKRVYHFGASLKDLGKKWFAFSKFDKEAIKILGKLG
jgi:phage regulator Rha-like protein